MGDIPLRTRTIAIAITIKLSPKRREREGNCDPVAIPNPQLSLAVQDQFGKLLLSYRLISNSSLKPTEVAAPKRYD